jgi:hypothetical protein
MTWSASSIQTHAPQGIDVFELDAQGRVVNQTVRGGRHQLACRPG